MKQPTTIMVRRLVIVCALLWGAVAAAEEPPRGFAWAISTLPAPDEARGAVEDMERLARAGGPSLSLWVSEDRAAIRITAPRAGATFEFPGAGHGFTVVDRGDAFDAVATACALVLRERFDHLTLMVRTFEDPALEPGAALFARVLGRAPPALRPMDDPTLDDEEDEPAVAAGPALGLGRDWLYPLLMVAFLWLRWRGGGNWTSYYLFWLVGPTLVFALAGQPLALLVIPVALVARRLLPDPILWLRHLRRIRSLSVDIASNASNAAARRSLAMVWLELRRPARALPLLDQALERVPGDVELTFLRGQALLGARRHAEALEAFLAVLAREPRLRYGEAYLRGADALIALERWDEAEEGLAHFVVVNRSSVEGRVKLARVRRARGDRPGSAAAVAEAKAAYRDSPAFHRRRQLWWYLRAVILGWRG